MMSPGGQGFTGMTAAVSTTNCSRAWDQELMDADARRIVVAVVSLYGMRRTDAFPTSSCTTNSGCTICNVLQ